jgi:hypothetical protein
MANNYLGINIVALNDHLLSVSEEEITAIARDAQVTPNPLEMPTR